MAFQITWSLEALEDLEQIAEYISKDSEAYAHSVVTEVVAATRILGQFPQMGRMVPEMGDPSIRERFIYSYRLIYKVAEEGIIIVGIIHGKRLLENLD